MHGLSVLHSGIILKKKHSIYFEALFHVFLQLIECMKIDIRYLIEGATVVYRIPFYNVHFS